MHPVNIKVHMQAIITVNVFSVVQTNFVIGFLTAEDLEEVFALLSETVFSEEFIILESLEFESSEDGRTKPPLLSLFLEESLLVISEEVPALEESLLFEGSSSDGLLFSNSFNISEYFILFTLPPPQSFCKR